LTAHFSLEPGLYYDTKEIGVKVLKNETITPIQQFLLDNGPIDLTYQQMYCTYKEK
jgi:hypothetical protein